MSQLVQVAGALAILAAFTAAQQGRVDVRGWSYLWLNFAGASVLAFDAWHEQQWGFLLLEAAWAVVSATGLVVRWRSDQAQ
jgi:hypothetical protein